MRCILVTLYQDGAEFVPRREIASWMVGKHFPLKPPAPMLTVENLKFWYTIAPT